MKNKDYGEQGDSEECDEGKCKEQGNEGEYEEQCIESQYKEQGNYDDDLEKKIDFAGEFEECESNRI